VTAALDPGDRRLTTAEAMAVVGITTNTNFTLYRKRVGLPGHPVPGDRRSLRFKLSDVEASPKARPMRERVWTAEQVAKLGKESDAEVGAAVGRTRDAVRKKRQKLGVPAHEG
jgi:hypothetical protein